MSQCKKCGVILPTSDKPGRPIEYCVDCEINRNRDRQLKFKNKHNKLVGNPKQDFIIVNFLRKRRKSEDIKYGNNRRTKE